MAALSALVADVAPARSHPHRVYFAQSQSPSSLSYRPRTLGVAGEGSFAVKRAQYRWWTRHSARGHGRGVQGFVGGPYWHGPVRFKLFRPRRKCGHRVWTRGVFNFPHSKPRDVPRHWHWKLAGFPCGV
jgi:hypothetical protein